MWCFLFSASDRYTVVPLTVNGKCFSHSLLYLLPFLSDASSVGAGCVFVWWSSTATDFTAHQWQLIWRRSWAGISCILLTCLLPLLRVFPTTCKLCKSVSKWLSPVVHQTTAQYNETAHFWPVNWDILSDSRSWRFVCLLLSRSKVKGQTRERSESERLY